MKTVACCTPYVPVEWIAAHGLRPQRLTLRTAERGATAAGLRGMCSFAGALIDTAADVEADALVVATTCDQLRRAATLAERHARVPLLTLHVPATWQTTAVRSYGCEELQRLSRFLVRLGGVVPDGDALLQAISESQAEECSLDENEPATDGVPLALLGGPLLAKARGLYDWVRQAGGRIVLDASEGGPRMRPRWPQPDRVRSKPLEAVAEAYFVTIPDAFRRPNTRLYKWLEAELAARQVRGLIFHRCVGCDIWHGEQYRLRQWSPVPVLDLDAGEDAPDVQSRTLGRIEAFLEMLR